MHDLWLEKIEEKQFDRYFKKAYTNAEAMRLDWKGIAFLITIEQILKHPCRIYILISDVKL